VGVFEEARASSSINEKQLVFEELVEKNEPKFSTPQDHKSILIISITNFHKKIVERHPFRPLTPETKKVTVPEPFAFDEREAKKGKSIRQKKLELFLREKENEIDELRNYVFRAKSVPGHVKIKNLYATH